VIATQNPLDLAGTFPLPVAQLDRFLFKIRMVPVAAEAERALLDQLDTLHARANAQRAGQPDGLPRVRRDEVLLARETLRREVLVAPMVKDALIDVAQATRTLPVIAQGVSTRSLVQAVPALQARAAMMGRDHVTDEDLAALLPLVFGHRIQLAPGAPPTDDTLRRCIAPVIERLARRMASGA
jgi:MoxR-like ATPase